MACQEIQSRVHILQFVKPSLTSFMRLKEKQQQQYGNNKNKK